MNDFALLRLAGIASVAAGATRIGTSFLVWDSTAVWQELLATGIDVLLLFGLMGAYLAHRAALGWAGLLAFVLAEAGIASIVGPDTVKFGVDTYLAGVHAISIGLALLGIVMLTARVEVLAAVCWIASLCVGLAGGFVGFATEAFMIGGILFGLGFVAAGISLLMPASKSA